MAKETPINVHLATKGSKSTTSYEVNVNIDFGGVTIDHPLEILNLDRWDMILGGYFCRLYNHRVAEVLYHSFSLVDYY